MKKILANDGISSLGKMLLEKHNYEVITEKVVQEDLIETINTIGYEVLLVRSDTKVRKDIIDECPSIKIIGRGGVGMDNIDVVYAKSKGIHVINTPAASSQSVAELVMAHIFSLSRGLYMSNKDMPLYGKEKFKTLKKTYSKFATEVRGKQLGIIGLGRIGSEVAKYAVSIGMQVFYTDVNIREPKTISIEINRNIISVEIPFMELKNLLATSDYISVNVPNVKQAIIGKSELNQMKPNAKLINASRGGVIDEDALIEALDNNQIESVALDVFVNEPTPRQDVLSHNKVSSTPHIAGSTFEAQQRIGEELATQIIAIFKD